MILVFFIGFLFVSSLYHIIEHYLGETVALLFMGAIFFIFFSDIAISLLLGAVLILILGFILNFLSWAKEYLSKNFPRVAKFVSNHLIISIALAYISLLLFLLICGMIDVSFQAYSSEKCPYDDLHPAKGLFDEMMQNILPICK